MELQHEQCQKLAKAIEELTTSGEPQLDGKLLAVVKGICRQSDGYVREAYHMLMSQLRKEHAEIRLSAFQIIDYLFRRSTAFRDLLLDDFKEYLGLTMEVDADCPLPLPKVAAGTLKSSAIKALHEWYTEFADEDKKLALAYNYLKKCKRIVFGNPSAPSSQTLRSQTEHQRSENLQRKRQLLTKQKAEKAVKEFREARLELQGCLTEIEACFALIFSSSSEQSNTIDVQHENVETSPSSQSAVIIEPVKIEADSAKPASISGLILPKGDSIGTPRPPESVPEACAQKSTGNVQAPDIIDLPTVETLNKTDFGVTQENPTPSKNPEGLSIGPTTSTDLIDEATVLEAKEEPPHSVTTELSRPQLQVESPKNDGAVDKVTPVAQQPVASTSKQDADSRTQDISWQNFSQSATEESSVDSDGSYNDCDSLESFSDSAQFSPPTPRKRRRRASSPTSVSSSVKRGGKELARRFPVWPLEGGSMVVMETEDNSAILEALRDRCQLAASQTIPKLNAWLNVLAKSSQHTDTIKQLIDLKQMFQECLNAYRSMRIISSARPDRSGNELQRTNSPVAGQSSVGIATGDSCNRSQESDENESENDEDSDFELVPEKEGLELNVPAHLRQEYGLDFSPPRTRSINASKTTAYPPSTTSSPVLPTTKTTTNSPVSRPANRKRSKLKSSTAALRERAKDPASFAATLVAWREMGALPPEYAPAPAAAGDGPGDATERATSSPKPGTSKMPTAGQKPSVPIVPFGRDLACWGDKEIKAPTCTRVYDIFHRFWAPREPETERVDHKMLEEMTSRKIDFSGKFQPIERRCNAPLKEGSSKLCPRMDRYKCPFHGRIVARDDKGMPVNEEEPTASQQTASSSTDRPWEDAELQGDIEGALGLQLDPRFTTENGKKKRRKSRRRYPGLTDLKSKQNTTRSRLEKRVLSKAALMRVAKDVTDIEYRRNAENFGNQFQYSYR